MELQGFGFTVLSFCMMVLLVLYKCSNTVKYYVKYLIYTACVMIAAMLFIPYFCFRPKNVENLLIYAEVLKHLTSVLGIKWTLRGAEHLNKNKSFVIVANHQTCLDIMDIWNVIKLMTAIAKKELLYAGTFGPAAYLAGLVFIDRNSSKGKEAMNMAMEKLKQDNIKLWVFPEGTRRSTGEIHQFKKGAFHTAIQYQIPIVPVVYSSYNHFLDHKQKVFGEGEVIINALPEISTKGLTVKDIDELMEHTKQRMDIVFRKISAEAAANLKDN
ncbi:1-acyl-sn-glycerol-3-phosphate acyltransferase alpha-like isoform X2 [Chironomus tepperi]|uniref:1-acyl-sn-glycerol-3-phosphate acyltransferase alpha-like isoform X2 n=1 Tax=Chironomus tepperi TaxID=113505 RepID=UPI00391F12F5